MPEETQAERETGAPPRPCHGCDLFCCKPRATVRDMQHPNATEGYKSRPQDEESTTRPDVLVARRAAAEWGVLSAAELRACGLSKDGIVVRVANGRLHRWHQGVYAVGHRSVPLEGRFLAAVKACGPRAVLSHFAAAALWGFVEWDGRYPEVTVPRASRQTHRSVFLHRSRSLAAIDTTRHRVIRVTTPARTAL